MPDPNPAPPTVAVRATPPDEAWAGDQVLRWLRQAPRLERQMAPISDVLFAAAAIQPGEAVLDVGCGSGPTTREAAERTGPSGAVTGLDISGDMLAAAAAEPVPGTGARIEWVETDVVTWTPPPGRYDLVLTRFGVMFFSDPPAAWRNLATATRSGGRIALAVWNRRTCSPLFELPYRTALEVRQAHGDDVALLPASEGPFSWHDAEAVSALLTGAGFREVAMASHRLALRLLGGVDPRTAALACCDFGPTRVILEGASDDTLAAALEALEAAFAAHVDDAGEVVLDADVRIVTARR